MLRKRRVPDMVSMQRISLPRRPMPASEFLKKDIELTLRFCTG
jgi:hypothetical protein